jgi:hypothetical protein
MVHHDASALIATRPTRRKLLVELRACQPRAIRVFKSISTLCSICPVPGFAQPQ